MKVKETQEDEEEEFKKELEKAAIQAEKEEQARKEAQETTSYIASNPQGNGDNDSKNSASWSPAFLAITYPYVP